MFPPSVRWVESMEWEGQADWLASPEVDWKVNGAKAGSIKASGPLSFVKVSGAGHMVPMVRWQCRNEGFVVLSHVTTMLTIVTCPGRGCNGPMSVPQDQPFNGLAMITAFTRGQDLVHIDSVAAAAAKTEAEASSDSIETVESSSAHNIQNQEFLERLAAAHHHAPRDSIDSTSSSVGTDMTWQQLHGGDRAQATIAKVRDSLPRDMALDRQVIKSS